MLTDPRKAYVNIKDISAVFLLTDRFRRGSQSPLAQGFLQSSLPLIDPFADDLDPIS